MLLSGYTLNNTTLINNLFQLEAGEYIVIDTELYRVQYNTYLAEPELPTQHKNPDNTLVEILNNVFASHLSALKNNMIAIPLSGGYDSRLISIMCSRYHPDNLIAFTYGTRNSSEIKLAKRVADKLAINWIPVYYDVDCIKDYTLSKTFESYYTYSSELSSIFFMQDYFAVKYLKDNQLIADNTVFLPGHSGDFLGGGHLRPDQNIRRSKLDISNRLFDRHFQLTKTSLPIRDSIMKLIMEKIPDASIPDFIIADTWDFSERQVKMIVNSANVFSFFGYSWNIPLWDNRLMLFFEGIGFEEKLYNNLYHRVLKQHYFEEKDLNFEDELTPSPAVLSRQEFKRNFKKFLPRFVVNSLVSNDDFLNYKGITAQLKEEISSQYLRPLKQKNYYNAYLAQYLISKTAQQLQSL